MNKIGIAFLCGELFFCAVVRAQEPADRVTVPLTDPSRPARIRAHLLFGSITVRGADVRDVEVTTHRRMDGGRHEHEHEREHPEPPPPPGMKRLDSPPALDVVETDNVVNIKTGVWGSSSDLVVTVPRHSSLELKTVNGGGITVEGVDGEIDADELNGSITLKDVSGSVVAHSLNGAVNVVLDQVDASKPMSFSTMNGDIDVTLPENARANLRMKTDNGAIYSDFDVKLSGGQSFTTDSGHHDGAYHIRLDRTLHGTINGGGPEYQFTSFNGRIYIRKKK